MYEESPNYIDIEDDIQVKEENKIHSNHQYELINTPSSSNESIYQGELLTYDEDDIKKLQAIDTPEYMSFNVEGHSLMSSDEVNTEAKWIARKVIAWKKIKNQKVVGNDMNWISSISDILKELFVLKKEVMYIYQYEKHLLTADVNLTIDDLWFIVEMDTKW